MSAAKDVLGAYQHVIDEVRLVTGDKGVFDVRVDGELIYSKHETGRHAEPGEVLGLLGRHLGEGVPRYRR